MLQDWGFEVEISVSGGRRGYLSATDSERANELSAGLNRTDIDLVWAARGGYGTVRILDRLAIPSWGNHHPALVGFSDLSLVGMWLHQMAQWKVVHAPNVTSLAELSGSASSELRRFLLAGRLSPWRRMKSIIPGLAIGPVVAMNLSLLCSVGGTPYQPVLADRIVVLEDCNEAPYRVDRMLQQVSRFADFPRIAGLVLGDFSGALRNQTLIETVASIAGKLGIPCVKGAPVGHIRGNFPVPLGSEVRLDANQGEMQWIQPVVPTPSASK